MKRPIVLRSFVVLAPSLVLGLSLVPVARAGPGGGEEDVMDCPTDTCSADMCFNPEGPSAPCQPHGTASLVDIAMLSCRQKNGTVFSCPSGDVYAVEKPCWCEHCNNENGGYCFGCAGASCCPPGLPQGAQCCPTVPFPPGYDPPNPDYRPTLYQISGFGCASCPTTNSCSCGTPTFDFGDTACVPGTDTGMSGCGTLICPAGQHVFHRSCPCSGCGSTWSANYCATY